MSSPKTGPVSSIELGGAEIAAYSSVHDVALVVGGDTKLRLVNLADIHNPKLITSLELPAAAQSVAVAGDLVAVALVNPADKAQNGSVSFFRLSGTGAGATLTPLGDLPVGALPDSVAFNAAGTTLVVANEGEAIDSTTTDAEGSISIINVAGFGPATADVTGFTVTTLGFQAYNNQKVKLELLGIRLSEGTPGATAAQDFEPEAIAIVGNTAYATLGENNAIVEIDLAAKKIVDIWSLGIKDWSRGIPEATNYVFNLDYTGTRPDFNANDSVDPGEVIGGGLSGLWYQGSEAGTEFYLTISDRGPQAANTGDRTNDNPNDPNKGQKIFDDPDFAPTVYRLAKIGDSVTVVDTISLKVPDGSGGFRSATGIGELTGIDDKAFALVTTGNGIAGDPNQYNVYAQVAWDAFGLDTESINYFSVAGLNGGNPVLAVSDEYRPQVALFDAATGHLIQRFVPSNTNYAAVTYEANRGDVAGYTSFTLPAVYGDRLANRGFEGMALNSKDGLLYAFVQSPLRPAGYKDKEFIRILAINPVTGEPVHEYLSLLPVEAGQDKIGDAVYDAVLDRFVIIERDGELGVTANKSITEISLKGATDTLDYTLAQNGKSWAAVLDGKTQPELVDIKTTAFGSIADLLAAQAIAMADREELFNLSSVLGANPDGSLAALMDDCADAAVDTLAPQPVWTKAEFEQLRLRVRTDLVSTATAILDRVDKVLIALREVEVALPDSPPPAQWQAIADIRAQLVTLTPVGFVTQTGATHLADLTRYLTAIARRLDRLPHALAADHERMQRVQAVQDAYDELLQALSPARRAADDVRDIAWMIQELRVSLWAQQLGTPRPVSEQRIYRAIDAVLA